MYNEVAISTWNTMNSNKRRFARTHGCLVRLLMIMTLALLLDQRFRSSILYKIIYCRFSIPSSFYSNLKINKFNYLVKATPYI